MTVNVVISLISVSFMNRCMEFEQLFVNYKSGALLRGNTFFIANETDCGIFSANLV